jgi:L-ascorbate metabolism protein UlaG (beta-lactamase superfamily)
MPKAGMRKSGLLAAAAAVGAVAAAAWTARNIRTSIGGDVTGERDVRILRSPQFGDGAFRNAVPASMPGVDAARKALREMLLGGQPRKPASPVPLVTPIYPPDEDLSAETLHLTWYGHASALVEIDAQRVLLDPVWSDRCSPSTLVGPRRLHPPPVPLDELPPLDAILISHDHYDHLDMPTVLELVHTQLAPFIVPLGVGVHLDRWGVPPARIIELDWNETFTLGGLKLTATAARHFSGRGFARDRTLWASWVLANESRRVFYTGDSGYFDGYATIGAEYGPFDASLIQIGAYSDGWPDIHMTPEEAIAAHLDLAGGLLVPVHWATFVLAPHAWSEPVDRLWREAKARDVSLAIPRPGERFDVDAPPPVDAWWQSIA